MTKDAIFRLYAMTKPFTSVAGMMLLEDGKLTRMIVVLLTQTMPRVPCSYSS